MNIADARNEPLGYEQAHELAVRLRTSVDSAIQLLDSLQADLVRAFEMQIWEGLDYDSWEAFIDVELPGLKRLRLPKSDRQQIVKALAPHMSNTAIADTLGISEATARRDVHATSSNDEVDDEPATRLGKDGKARKAPSRSKKEPACVVDERESQMLFGLAYALADEALDGLTPNTRIKLIGVLEGALTHLKDAS